MILREKFEYYNTEYNPDSELTKKPFTRFADFQNLAYADEQFNCVLASDVFEHIRDDENAFSEVFRVLKPNGVFILTVPYEHEWAETLLRVKAEGGKDVFLLPPEYHGGGGQTLAYRKYGRDLLDRLRRRGFSVGYLDLEVSKYNIDRQPVFIGMKSTYIDLSRFLVQEKDDISQKALKASPLILFRVFVTIKYNLSSVRHFASEVVRKLSDTFRNRSKTGN